MRRTLTAAAILLASATVSNAATVVNGDFEQPGTYSGSFSTLSAGSTALTGWTIESGSIDLINSYWYNASGNYSVDMSGGSAATISQLVTDLVVGNWYSVFFDLSGNPVGGNAVKSLSASLGMDGGGTFSFDTTGYTTATMGWFTNSFAFQASETTGLLTFASNETTPMALRLITCASCPK